MSRHSSLVHKDRNLSHSESEWISSFHCSDLRPLIVCRGPIRLEAMEVFDEMGITHYGMLLSEKDSIVFPHALAPELRKLNDPHRVHRVPDYSGATREERLERIAQIIDIAKSNNYNAIFAGYGFMAEDAEFVGSIENAGLIFMGPCSKTQLAAGQKDEAKLTALKVGVSVTPGISNLTARTLIAKYPNKEKLLSIIGIHQLSVNVNELSAINDVEAIAESLLQASYEKGIDLFSIDELAEQAKKELQILLKEHQGKRFRLKAIGGGGGKGQRIVSKAEDVPPLVKEVLQEVKATGVGDNKNMLIELNIEQTRHNEIQLVGNGKWCVALGGRDCSLQMHEQKLVEISVTQEELQRQIEEAKKRKQPVAEKVLKKDLEILTKMEKEAESFGKAVGLDSLSTFECIVEKDRHYFMEVNTRIQVEHRVTELCYSLKFTNPDNSEDFFTVDSLVQMMAILASHKDRLPKPVRLPRFGASVEVRLNATDASLSPHAGSTILYWSAPIEGEIRDDQGISLTNPDTHSFMHYKVSGAYDSNLALLLTKGDDRKEAYQKMSDVLAYTRLRGKDFSSNLEFHYGLISWLLGENVMAKPTTKFVIPYLNLIGKLKSESNLLDTDFCYAHFIKNKTEHITDSIIKKESKHILQLKSSLLLRPVTRLLKDVHLLSGWLSLFKKYVEFENNVVKWKINPIMLLDHTYRYLNMSWRENVPAADIIWDHDNAMLKDALSFYEQLSESMQDVTEFGELTEVLSSDRNHHNINPEIWKSVQAAHAGYQLGTEILKLPFYVGLKVNFGALHVNEELEVVIPDDLQDPALYPQTKKILVPPPATKADEINAMCSGMYYAQESPGQPPFVAVGQHFKKGDTLYIIEVMKMFNVVKAPFSGTITKVLLSNTEGVIVSKGQPLFKIIPDERFIPEDPILKQKEIEKTSLDYVHKLIK